MSREVVVLVGNPRPGSRTRSVAERLATELGADAAVVLELADLSGVTWTAEPAVPAAADEQALDTVRAARILIVATPSYKGTYTGLLKLFLDRFEAQALAGVTAIPVAVAGSPDHASATAADLARLLGELGAEVPATVALLESQLAAPDFSGAISAVRATV